MGVLYKRKLFPSTKEFIEWMHKFPEICLFNDDMIIGAWLDQKRHPKYLLPFYSYLGTKCNHKGDWPKLSTDNLKGRNEKIFHIMHGEDYRNEALSSYRDKISLSLSRGSIILDFTLFYNIIIFLIIILILIVIMIVNRVR
jgi:hypothetical protein